VNETTAQDASGATIAPWDDLKADVFLLVARSRAPRLESTPGVWSNDPSRAPTKRPWTLPDPWTHRTRPPVLGKPRTVFHQRPPPSSCPDQEEGRQLSHTARDRPATITEFPLRSPAALLC